VQAAVLSVKIRRLESWNVRRRERASVYSSAFRAAGLAPSRGRAARSVGDGHVFHQYVIRYAARDDLREHLSRGVETQIYYPIPLHLQPWFPATSVRRRLVPGGEAGRGRKASALPIYPELRDDQIEHVVSTIGEFCRRQMSRAAADRRARSPSPARNPSGAPVSRRIWRHFLGLGVHGARRRHGDHRADRGRGALRGALAPRAVVRQLDAALSELGAGAVKTGCSRPAPSSSPSPRGSVARGRRTWSSIP